MRLVACLAGLSALVYAQSAAAQEPGTPVSPPPSETPAPPPPPPPPPPEAATPTSQPTVTPSPEPGRPPASSEPAPPPQQEIGASQLLAPRFPEDHYPGEANEAGFMPGVPLNDKGMRFAMHGYFRAPMRISWVPRAAGSTKPGEGDTNWRSPYLIDDDYFRSGFAYTPVSETDFSELYFSVGNDKLTGTIQFQGSLYSDAARPLIDKQSGISQGYLTYRFSPDFVPYFKTRVRVKGGAFWDRFGYLPKYDTYIFGRTHQMGEQVRVDLERDKTTIWLLDGFGTHLEDVSSNEGLTMQHYAQVGASYDRTVELSGFFLDAVSKDKKPLKEITDAELQTVGADLRADTHYAGHIYGATSYVSLTNATYLAPSVEMMHSLGGRGLTENYLGTQSSQNGTGSMWNVGGQYDLSLAEEYRAFSGRKSGPLPWNGDFTASFFALYSFVQSKQQSPDPLVNKDDHKYWKWGVDGGYRITDWVGVSCRYDRVVMDVTDSANSFRIISPRLAFFTSFLTKEMLFIQYSRYIYNDRIRLRPGQVQLETLPDDNVLKIQAQMTF